MTAAALWSPVTLIIPVVLILGVWATLSFGLAPTLVLVALVALTTSGTITRYAPAAAVLNQAGVIIFVVVGVLVGHRLRLGPWVRASGTVFLLAATIGSLAVIGSSYEFALRGWISLVAPVFAALAVGGSLVAKSDLPDERLGRARRVVVGALVVATVANVLFGLRQALFGLNGPEIAAAQAGESTYLVGDQIRLMGMFSTNQDFAVFSACLAPAILVLGANLSGKAKRWAYVLAGALYVVVLLSLTRTALIAGVIAGLIGLIIWGRGALTGRVVRISLTLSALVGLTLLVIGQIDNARIQDSLTRASTLFSLDSDVSYNARSSSTLPRAIAIIQDFPFGLGAGSAGPISNQFPLFAPLGGVTTDNGYLMITIQLGILGALSFVALLLSALCTLGRSQTAFGRSAAAAMLGLIVAMLVAQYWSLLAPVSLAGAMIGIGFASMSRPAPASFAEAEKPDASQRVHLVARGA